MGHSKAEYCFVFDKEIQQGPFPPGKVQRMLRDSEISDQAFVWREGMTDWPPIGSVLPRLATIRQKEYLKFLAHAIPRELTFDEAQSMLDAIIADNPAKKLPFERWDQLAQKRDAVATYFGRSEIRCPVSEFEIVPFLEEVQAADPEQFSSLPSYDIARLLKARREHRGWEDESPTEAQKAV